MSRNSLAEEAFNRLREAIASGELRPNQRLVESQVAKTLRISRTPIREAFTRLENTAYLTRLDTGGVVVIDHSHRQIQDMFEIRKALEAAAIKLACHRITDDQILKAEEYQIRAADEAHNRNIESFIKYNTTFHEYTYACCGNERLLEIVMSFRDHYFLRRIVHTFTGSDWRRNIVEHSRLIKAIKERDVRRAQSALEKHLDSVQKIALKRL